MQTAVIRELEEAQRVSDGRPAGVGVFRIQMIALIVLYSTLVYGGIFLLTRTLLIDSVSEQARSYASLVLDTRTWNASHGGAWVIKTDVVESNPYLTQMGIPGTITAVDGRTLVLRDHATMTREISEISQTHRGIWFHLTALDYINPVNAPDTWELDALERIAQGEDTVEGISEIDGKRAYRVAAGLVVSSDCVTCHKDYRVGDTRGAVTVNIPMTRTETQLRRAAMALVGLGVLTLLLSLIALQLMLKRMQDKIAEANSQLERAAITDALTGVMNRGATFARLAEEFERARRSEEHLSVIMLDLDHFKRINDTFGHAVGDSALQDFCDRMRASIRAYDTVGRIGGEEFLIVAPETDGETALGLALRVLERVRSAPMGADDRISLTASAGIASIRPDDAGLDTLLGRADAALYRAKSAGRDRAESADACD